MKASPSPTRHWICRTAAVVEVSGDRVLEELDELAALTGDDRGAQRLVWSEPWYRARQWLREKLDELPVDVEEDQAGNLWATLKGASEKEVIVGSHLDSVPDGGRLDGALGVVAGLGLLRGFSAAGRPPLTLRLVDFAEEEGDQTNFSTLGSTAVSGMLDLEHLRKLRTMDDLPLPEFLAGHGIDIERMNDAATQLENAVVYLELHIEQSTRLEREGIPLGAVTGTAGVERAYLHFSGRRDHTARPMEERRDALMAVCRFIVELRDLARAIGSQSLASHVVIEPNVQLIVADEAGTTFDVRAFDQETLERFKLGWREIAKRIAAEEGVEVRIEPRWGIAPSPFDPRLIELAEEAIKEASGAATRLGSPQLHDSGQVALAGVPTSMIFVQSRGGISHNRDEASDPAHLRMGVEALGLLAEKAMRAQTE